MNDEREVAVVGSEELVLGFRLAGVEKTFVPEDFESTIEDLMNREDIGIIVTEESRIQEASKRVRKNIESSVEPVVIGLSEEAESERLQNKIKKAIGADIT